MQLVDYISMDTLHSPSFRLKIVNRFVDIHQIVSCRAQG